MPQNSAIDSLIAQLDALIAAARALEKRYAEALAAVHPEFSAGARNLVHYVALRHVDNRELQERLRYLGLSSLGRAEQNVLCSLESVRNALCKLNDGKDYDLDAAGRCIERSKKSLDRNTVELLGGSHDGRETRIMVTMPDRAADDPALVRGMIEAGMDIARINCAHGNAAAWQRTIGNLARGAEETGRDCRVFMDLAGPKIRTGDLRRGPGVLRIRPKRDSMGSTVAPRKVSFVPEGAPRTAKKSLAIPVPRACIEQAKIGDVFRFRDARGKKRVFEVAGKSARGLRLLSRKTAYLATGTRLERLRDGSPDGSFYRVGELPPVEEPIVLRVGDTLVLHRASIPGEAAELDVDETVVEPAHIACRQPEVFRFVAAGEPVFLNDGKIGGVVRLASNERLVIEITDAKRSGSPLRADKGINFPASEIDLTGLTENDKANLGFVVRHADAVSLSFVRRPADIESLYEELRRYPCSDLGIVIKIETVAAFDDLPRLLLATMRRYPAGVMIARGDLAVECGWERLAEIQEEILWMCEAAHLPVIWATAVLEQETKTGRPSRAEITDAAMAQRADCVMLNKGPHIRAAIRMLDDILRRMQGHQHKKTPTLRKLSITEI